MLQLSNIMQLSKEHSAKAEKWLKYKTVHDLRMVGVTGVEPVTSSLSGMRSNQLSYTPASEKMVEVNGIEPMTS